MDCCTGINGGMDLRGGLDASGRKGKGKGVYQFVDKYGANVDGYSPIYDPKDWSPSGEVYVGGTTGLLIWAVTLAGLLAGGALLVYNTNAFERRRYRNVVVQRARHPSLEITFTLLYFLGFFLLSERSYQSSSTMYLVNVAVIWWEITAYDSASKDAELWIPTDTEQRQQPPLMTPIKSMSSEPLSAQLYLEHPSLSVPKPQAGKNP
ncbi:hypothetical protein D5086_022522 [Populus alba]|uniref:Uncharacterized protein n=1 Tax=Populus alba TaxID=43335 RepID=A0ACC4BGQ2_POPAL